MDGYAYGNYLGKLAYLHPLAGYDDLGYPHEPEHPLDHLLTALADHHAKANNMGMWHRMLGKHHQLALQDATRVLSNHLHGLQNPAPPSAPPASPPPTG